MAEVSADVIEDATPTPVGPLINSPGALSFFFSSFPFRCLPELVINIYFDTESPLQDFVYIALVFDASLFISSAGPPPPPCCPRRKEERNRSPRRFSPVLR